MIGIRGSRYAVLNVYIIIVVMSFTHLVHGTDGDDSVKVNVHTDNSSFSRYRWHHVAARVSGGGAWLRGRGCLSNDTCASSNKRNAIKVGEYQSCINDTKCTNWKFTATVVDSAQVLRLRIFRYQNGTTLHVTASCENTSYTLWTSHGVPSFVRFTYSELTGSGGTWSRQYKCENKLPTNNSTTTAEPPNTTRPTLTPIPTEPKTSTGNYNLSTSRGTSSAGSQNSTLTTVATSESADRGGNQTERADKSGDGPDLTTIIVPVVVGVVAVVAIVAVVLVVCRHKGRKAESPPSKSGAVIQNPAYYGISTSAEDHNIIATEEPNHSPLDQNVKTNPNGSANDDPDNSSELSYQLLVRSTGENSTSRGDNSNPAPPEEYTAVVKPNSHKFNYESQAEELYCEVDTIPTDVVLPKVDLVENDLYDSFCDETEPPSEYYNL